MASQHTMLRDDWTLRGKAIRVGLLPARRVGRRRCKLPKTPRTPKSPRLPASLKPQPIWCPADSIQWNSAPLLLQAHAEYLCGGKVGQAAGKPTTPPIKVKAKYDGRIWTVDAPENACWRDIQWAFAAKFHMGAAELLMQHSLEEVNLADRLPVANQHGHIHIDIFKLEQIPGRRPMARARSRTPARQAPPLTHDRGVQTDLKVIDMEAIYFNLSSQNGSWLLKLSLEEIGASDWRDVAVGRAAAALQRLYPTCFDQEVRLCIAVENQLLKPTDTLIDFVTRHNTQIHILPAPLLGASRSSYDWGPPDDSSSEPSSEAEPPPHMYVLWRQGGVFYPHRVHLDSMDDLTWMQLERRLLDQHPMLRFWGRPIFANLAGQVLGLSTVIQPSRTPAILAFPSPEFGASGDLYDEALAIAKNVAADQHKVLQLKLLLRGEPGLQQRLVKNSHDTKRCRQVILELGVRYGMATQHNGAAVKSPPSKPPDPPTSPPITTSTWRMAAAKRRTQQIKHDLTASDWSVPVCQDLQFNKPAVYFPKSQDEAEALARRVGKPQQPTAILSLRPLPDGKDIAKITFRALSRDEQGHIKERTFVGYMNQYGEKPVLYRETTMHLEHVSLPSTSVKIILKSRKDAVEDKDWKSLLAATDKKAFVQYIKTWELQCIDWWDRRLQADSWSAAVRIPKRDLHKWMVAATPFSVSLGADQAAGYRVTWGSDVLTLRAAQKRYEEVPGYEGVILGRDNLGVRILDSAFDQAMSHLGKPTGETYELRGLPLHVSEPTLESLLAQLNWSATLVAGFRKVVRGHAIFKVRTSQEPPCDILRFTVDGEIVQVQLAKLHQRRMPQPKESPASITQPTTWEAASRHAIGIQRTTEVPEEPPPPSEGPDPGDIDDSMDSKDEPGDDVTPEQNLNSTWARRLREPATKVRKREPTAVSDDPRIDMLMQKMEQLTAIVAGLSATHAPPTQQY